MVSNAAFFCGYRIQVDESELIRPVLVYSYPCESNLKCVGKDLVRCIDTAGYVYSNTHCVYAMSCCRTV